MVVEFLTFPVPAELRAQWLAVEQQTWSRFLSRQRGFRSKQLWVDRDAPDQIHAVIVWDDEQAWMSIPARELDEVDAAMGEYRRDPTMRVFDVLDEIT